MCLRRSSCVRKLCSHREQRNGFVLRWMIMWRFKLPLVVKEESHTLHLNAFTPAERQTGRKKNPDMILLPNLPSVLCILNNRNKSRSQLIGYTSTCGLPVCVFRWDLRTPVETKFRPHRLHTYGFSPVCERMCCFRWLDFLKPLSHTLHLYMDTHNTINHRSLCSLTLLTLI